MTASVAPAPTPPAALVGRWKRTVDTSSLKNPPGIENPSGTYTMVIDKRWIQVRFPGRFVPGEAANASVHNGDGWIIESDWIGRASTLPLLGAVNFHLVTDQVAERGYWCGPGRPPVSYRWDVSGDTLTITPASNDSCAGRKLIWSGTWTRVG